MKASQKIALEMSAKKETLNSLLALDEMTDEQRTQMGELTTGLQSLEVEARAAIMAEGETTFTHASIADGEDRELRCLIDRANVGNIFEAALEDRSTDGAEAELQTHFGLAANAIPMALLETRAVTEPQRLCRHVLRQLSLQSGLWQSRRHLCRGHRRSADRHGRGHF